MSCVSASTTSLSSGTAMGCLPPSTLRKLESSERSGWTKTGGGAESWWRLTPGKGAAGEGPFFGWPGRNLDMVLRLGDRWLSPGVEGGHWSVASFSGSGPGFLLLFRMRPTPPLDFFFAASVQSVSTGLWTIVLSGSTCERDWLRCSRAGAAMLCTIDSMRSRMPNILFWSFSFTCELRTYARSSTKHDSSSRTRTSFVEDSRRGVLAERAALGSWWPLIPRGCFCSAVVDDPPAPGAQATSPSAAL
mmetsp:Transcript_10239/g.41697  ORF Transcript_10239/g.41697 Transcript_10239/m.41697 type:complete len:247 (+) Transcript_10239:1564-2304(+)